MVMKKAIKRLAKVEEVPIADLTRMEDISELLSYQRIGDIDFGKFTIDYLLELMKVSEEFTEQIHAGKSRVDNIFKKASSLNQCQRRRYCI